jgi:hypothetical protein
MCLVQGLSMANQKNIYAVFLLALIPLLGLCAYGAWILDSFSTMFINGSAAGEVFSQQVKNDNIAAAEISERLKTIAEAEFQMGVHTKGLMNSYYFLVISAIGIAVLQVKLFKAALKTHNKNLKRDC